MHSVIQCIKDKIRELETLNNCCFDPLISRHMWSHSFSELVCGMHSKQLLPYGDVCFVIALLSRSKPGAVDKCLYKSCIEGMATVQTLYISQAYTACSK